MKKNASQNIQGYSGPGTPESTIGPAYTQAKHTPGPWVSRLEEMGGYDCMTDAAHIIGPDGTNIATLDAQHYGQENCRPQPVEGAVLMEFNAARIVDCVNACEGMVSPKYEVEHLLGAIDAITDALPKIERAGNSMELDAALDCLRPFARKHGRAV